MKPSASASPSTEARIRTAAIELFATKGFAGTSIRDLAQHAGITTATLYHYVSSKDDLLDDIVEQSMTRLIEAALRWERSNDTIETKLAALIAIHVSVHANAPQRAIVVDRQLGAMRKESFTRAVRQRDCYERIWRNVIADGIASGVFHAHDPKVATLALLGATTAIADWYRPKGGYSIEKLSTQFVALGFSMLGVAVANVPEMPDISEVAQSLLILWEKP